MPDVTEMFGPNASKYTTSTVHNNPVELDRLVQIVKPLATDKLLDVATGSGNTAIAFAPFVAEAIALDITLPMLDEVMKNARELNLQNVSTRFGNAESLPFDDNFFDIVTVRLAPHHFQNPAQFVSEVARVLKPEGKFLLVDTAGLEEDEADNGLHKIEILRDPSHVRNLKVSEWKSLFSQNHLDIEYVDEIDDWKSSESDDGRMEYEVWVNRINTPMENRPELRNCFLNASPKLVEAMKITTEKGQIRFSLPRVTMLARKKKAG